MYRIRPIAEQDYEGFVSLAMQAHLGMTNLPKNREKLEQLLDKALRSFQEDIAYPGNDYYLFVLEDMETADISGVSGIYARTGLEKPLDYFVMKEYIPPALFKEVPASVRYLERVQYKDGPTEICSLFLTPTSRKAGLGKLLSLSRFLFMKKFPERFTESVFADMRGIIDDNGRSLFWEALGKKFLPIEFNELMRRRDSGNDDILQLMPMMPVYLSLLPDEVVANIGRTHPNTLPALQMLLNQGFKLTDEVDLFDAGPRVMGELLNIKCIRETKTGLLKGTLAPGQGETALLANGRLDFRACMGHIATDAEGNVQIDKIAAAALEIEPGELLYYHLL